MDISAELGLVGEAPGCSVGGVSVLVKRTRASWLFDRSTGARTEVSDGPKRASKPNKPLSHKAAELDAGEPEEAGRKRFRKGTSTTSGVTSLRKTSK